jgi:putative component of toxin-antitoxin plasmid stabilization module
MLTMYMRSCILEPVREGLKPVEWKVTAWNGRGVSPSLFASKWATSWMVQRGLEPSDWKPMPTVGSGVCEVRIHGDGEHRVIYVARFRHAIYVLHVFRKKTQKTSKRDIGTAKARFVTVLQMEVNRK